MERTRFEVRFDPEPLPEDAWSPAGIDRAEFFVSPNPGEDLRPLARIVSGGELSRVMLAIKTLTLGARLSGAKGSERRRSAAERRRAPGVIFDEVDAGIGGRVADVVGRNCVRWARRSRCCASRTSRKSRRAADTHFQIEKSVDRGRTRTTVARLDDDGRVEEIESDARRLGGHGGRFGRLRERCWAGAARAGESERAKAKAPRKRKPATR